MQIGKYDFVLGSVIEVRRDEHREPVLSFPSMRYNNHRNLKLNQYGNGPFVFLQLSQLPAAQGVYAVVADSRDVLYVGQSADTIRTRWKMGYASIQPRNCFEGGQPTNCRVNNLIYQALMDGRRLELYVITTDDFDAIERDLILRLQPNWNRRGIQ